MYSRTELSVLVQKQATTPMTIIEVPVISSSVGREKFSSGTILKIYGIKGIDKELISGLN